MIKPLVGVILILGFVKQKLPEPDFIFIRNAHFHFGKRSLLVFFIFEF